MLLQPRAQPNGQGASRHYHDADNHQPISGCKLNGAPSGHLLGAHSKAHCRPCNSMVHLGELEHWLFVYFMMHFGLSQLHCYPTPVRSPFSGLITDSTLCGVRGLAQLFLFLMRHVYLVPDYQHSGAGKRQKISLNRHNKCSRMMWSKVLKWI